MPLQQRAGGVAHLDGEVARVACDHAGLAREREPRVEAAARRAVLVPDPAVHREELGIRRRLERLEEVPVGALLDPRVVPRRRWTQDPGPSRFDRARLASVDREPDAVPELAGVVEVDAAFAAKVV